MNAILNKVIESRGGQYCHVLEVSDVYELENILENIYCEFIDEFSIDEIIEFCYMMEIYCLNEENETEVFEFHIEYFLKQL
jgi:hypothetical protein